MCVLFKLTRLCTAALRILRSAFLIASLIASLMMGLGAASNVFAQEPVQASSSSGLIGSRSALISSSSALNSSQMAAEQLVTILEKFKSLEGHFAQSLHSKAGKLLQSTQGVFKIKRPGLYLWQSAEPYPQTIVGNGQTIWVYDPDLEQVTITPQAQMPLNPAMLLSGGIDDLSARFNIEQVAQNAQKGQSVFNLTPVNTADAPFELISLTFVNDQIASAELTDRLAQKTLMSFTELKANSAISDVEFTFVPPKGTDVLMNE